MSQPLSSLCGHQSASHRRADCNVAVVSHGQYVSTLTAAADSHVNTAVSKVTVDLDLLTLKLGGRVTCYVGYLCANFTLPRNLRS